MEIDNVQVVKPFGPLILIAQLPEGVIKPLNEIVDVIKDRKDMGARLAGVIETESEIPHSMLEEKKVMNIFHALSRSYLEQAYLNAGLHDQWNAMNVKTQMQSIWSVSQYENEYNPQHNHSHCQISAVLYLKIPAMKSRNIPNKPKEKEGWLAFGNLPKKFKGVGISLSKKKCLKENMITLRRDGVNKILYGLTTFEEILSITSN